VKPSKFKAPLLKRKPWPFQPGDRVFYGDILGEVRLIRTRIEGRSCIVDLVDGRAVEGLPSDFVPVIEASVSEALSRSTEEPA